MGDDEVAMIIGIGLNETGTRSLASALRIYGSKILRKTDEAISQSVIDTEVAGLPLLVGSVVGQVVPIDSAPAGAGYVVRMGGTTERPCGLIESEPAFALEAGISPQAEWRRRRQPGHR